MGQRLLACRQPPPCRRTPACTTSVILAAFNVNIDFHFLPHLHRVLVHLVVKELKAYSFWVLAWRFQYEILFLPLSACFAYAACFWKHQDDFSLQFHLQLLFDCLFFLVYYAEYHCRLHDIYCSIATVGAAYKIPLCSPPSFLDFLHKAYSMLHFAMNAVAIDSRFWAIGILYPRIHWIILVLTHCYLRF